MEYVEEVEIYNDKFCRILDRDEQEMKNDFMKENIDITMRRHDEDGLIYWMEVSSEDPRTSEDTCVKLTRSKVRPLKLIPAEKKKKEQS